MTVLQAFVLGIVQGLSEFLPISSSAHLSLTPWLFGWESPGLAFDISLHVGTLVAVVFYFRREWRELIVAWFSLLRKGKIETIAERRAAYLLIATIPAGIAGLALEEYAETVFRAPVITALMLIILGVILWAVDRWVPHRRSLDDMRWTDALLIGIAQCLALVPGVSRSGSTITMGRALGFDRQGAAVFSFLMSMPIIAAAALFKVPDALAETGITLPLVVGVVSAAVSSAFAIAILLRYVSRRDYGIFAVYRVLLGTLVLWLLFSQSGINF
ncbi:MAG TPA: undecaprenyl-diphosphatase UppP [Gemmatimonadales bacterium]|nr:undecaprenyl-diphosphatase UppP [Gemmatimonadales bacterium]